MVPVLVLLTFAVLVALDYFVFKRGYLEEKSGWPSKLETLPAATAQSRVPDGVFLQPTYTWSRVGDRGGVYVGVHPLLLGLIGESCEMELRQPGERVAKGDALVSLWSSGRRLTVRSPLAGRVERANRRAAASLRWREVAGEGGPWLYRLKAERAADEESLWLSGEAALEWTRRQYQLLRAYLQEVITAGHLGTVMADGGELPDGILREMDEGAWRGLETRFLGPSAPAATRSAEGQA